MRSKPRRIARVRENPLARGQGGLRLCLASARDSRFARVLIAVCSSFGASYMTLLPAFARDVLHEGSTGLEFLYSAVGGGALIGAYALARVPDRHLKVAPPIVAALGLGISLILHFPIRTGLRFRSRCCCPTSFSLMLLGGSTNTLIQTLSRDDVCAGAVVALYAMGVMGMMPWGVAAAGVARRKDQLWTMRMHGHGRRHVVHPCRRRRLV